jgi:hypothetical protein
MPDRTGFFVVGGTLGGNVDSYVRRPLDDELLQLTLAGEYCNVLAARQMGKSSLMVRTAQKLREHGVRPIIIDITAIGSSVSASEWYFGLLSRLARELKLDLDEQEWWRSIEEKSPVQRFSDFLRDVILEKIKEPIVIFIDEIDSTLKLDFTDDFFAAIRAIYNARSRDEAYKRLSFVLLGVARPGDLIKDRTRTPYNIGFNLEVTDFQEKELGAFQKILEKAFPNSGGQILSWALDWTGGQPYLTQKLCAELVEGSRDIPQNGDVANLVERIFLNDQARTETNLRAIRDRIQTSPHLLEMLAVYKRVLAGRKVAAEERSIAQNELKLTGLVRVSPKGTLQIRNRIYGHVFNADWVRNSIPVNVTNRRWITAISSVAVLAIAAAGFFYYRQANQALEIQAQTYLEGFNSSTSQEVRITNLAGLIGLGGEYATQAQDLFLSLTYEDQLALFDLTTPDNVGNGLVVVVDGVYQTTENTAEGNALLSAMAIALEGTTATGSVGLVIEINAWVDGREALRQGQYEVAVASLTTAWERSEQRGNPNLSALFERASAHAWLDEHEEALSDFDLVLQSGSDLNEKVISYIENDRGLKDFFDANATMYPNIARVIEFDPPATITPSPMPTATLVYDAGSVLLEKNLDDNSLFGWYSPWCLNSRNRGQVWSIVEESDGNKVLAGKTPAGDECGIFLGSDTWSNYQMEADIMTLSYGLDSYGSTYAFWIGIRFGSYCQGYETHFGSSNFIGVSLLLNGTNTECNYKNLHTGKSGILSRNEWHKVKVVVYLSDIKVYLDSELIHAIEDDKLSAGIINIGVSGLGEIYLDNLRVVELVAR